MGTLNRAVDDTATNTLVYEITYDASPISTDPAAAPYWNLTCTVGGGTQTTLSVTVWITVADVFDGAPANPTNDSLDGWTSGGWSWTDLGAAGYWSCTFTRASHVVGSSVIEFHCPVAIPELEDLIYTGDIQSGSSTQVGSATLYTPAVVTVDTTEVISTATWANSACNSGEAQQFTVTFQCFGTPVHNNVQMNVSFGSGTAGKRWSEPTLVTNTNEWTIGAWVPTNTGSGGAESWEATMTRSAWYVTSYVSSIVFSSTPTGYPQYAAPLIVDPLSDESFGYETQGTDTIDVGPL